MTVTSIKYPHEIHITVAINNDKEMDTFRNACKSLKVKPIIVQLGKAQHVMTSSTYVCDTDSAITKASYMCNRLENHLLSPIRTKIETVPHHPKTLSPEVGNYFESHIAVQHYQMDTAKLQSIIKNYPELHLSSNAFKRTQHFITTMVTIRDRDLQNVYTNIEKCFKLLTPRFILNPPIVEFCIYDSNETLDVNWLTTSQDKTTIQYT